MNRLIYYKYLDELRYYGRGSNAEIHVNIGDAEIIFDEKGEIVDLVIYNASKYLEPREIEKIAEIIEKPPKPEKKS